MNDFMTIVAPMIGFFLGFIFFGGLWFTVKKAIQFKRPALWFLGSFIIRTGITLLGFYYVAQGEWYHLLICLIGFIVGRYIVMRITKSKDVNNVTLDSKH